MVVFLASFFFLAASFAELEDNQFHSERITPVKPHGLLASSLADLGVLRALGLDHIEGSSLERMLAWAKLIDDRLHVLIITNISERRAQHASNLDSAGELDCAAGALLGDLLGDSLLVLAAVRCRPGDLAGALLGVEEGLSLAVVEVECTTCR